MVCWDLCVTSNGKLLPDAERAIKGRQRQDVSNQPRDALDGEKLKSETTLSAPSRSCPNPLTWRSMMRTKYFGELTEVTIVLVRVLSGSIESKLAGVAA